MEFAQRSLPPFITSLLAMMLLAVPVDAQLQPDDAAVDIETLEIDPDQPSKGDDEDDEDDSDDRGEARVIEPDSTRTIDPDASDAIRPDAADTVRPDSDQRIRPDSARTIEPDRGEVIRPDGPGQTINPDDTTAIRPDGADLIEIDRRGSAIDPEAGQPIDPDAAAKLDEQQLRVVAERRTGVLDAARERVVRGVDDLRSTPRAQLNERARLVRGQLENISVEIDNLGVAYRGLEQQQAVQRLNQMRGTVDRAQQKLRALQRVRDPEEILQQIDSLNRTIGQLSQQRAQLQIPSSVN